MNADRYRCVKLSLIALFLAIPYSARAAESVNEPKERTVSVLEQALKTDPQNSELWVHLGFAYRKLDKIDQAQGAFEKAANLNPQGTEAFYMLGLIYESKHDTSSAQKAWKNYLAAEKDAEKRAVAEKHLHHLSQ